MAPPPASPTPPRPRRQERTKTIEITGFGDIVEVFDKSVAVHKVSPETALLLLLRKYNIDEFTLKRLAELKVNRSYSTVKYTEIAPLFNLEPQMKTADFWSLQIHRSRIPKSLLRQTLANIQASDMQYGGIAEHDNESARCGYLNGLFSAIVCLFKKRIVNKPEQKLTCGVANRGEIEFRYVALDSIIVLFIEVKKEYLSGKALLTQIAQVMAEADG